ncbi:amidophosphoribosyltransferase [Nocardia sp. NPDC049220]|uniref:ComF family protein n=1 Tax=Nocardia sp. NPDC049220 TaxID=3155273 RepID=UPI0033FAC49F
MMQIGPQAGIVRQITQERVGKTFRNAYVAGTPDVCDVCRGPAPATDVCSRCQQHATEFGPLLADRTVVLTYAQGNHPAGIHQSAHEVRAYKQGADQCMQNLQLLMKLGATIHQHCIAQWVGALWDAVTFVPSMQRPGPDHPVAALANAVVQDLASPVNIRKFLIEPGPGVNVKRVLVGDRFVVPDIYRPVVEGKRVLIVDDTWTTGASVQGAAIAVKNAGASSVTAFCFDRWLRWDWDDHKQLLGSLDADARYDPLRCPVSGSVCAYAANFRLRF